MALTTPDMPVGERIRTWRMYRGMTQERCAEQVGRSLSWWRKAESGARRVDSLADLLLVARVLKVTHLEEITGPLGLTVCSTPTREHPLLLDMRQAMADGLDPLVLTDQVSDGAGGPAAPSTPDTLRSRLDDTWLTWRTDRLFVAAVGRIWPGLLRAGCQVYRSAHLPDDGAGGDRRGAARLLAEIYLMACHWFRHVSAFAMAEQAAERATTYAHESGDPVAVALAAWQRAGVLKDTRRFEEAAELCLRTDRMLRPTVTDGAEESLAMWGHVQLQTALSAAYLSDEDMAGHHLELGADAARRLGPTYVHPITVFGAVNVTVFEVRCRVALGQPAAAIATADRFDFQAAPARSVRVLGLIDLACGYAARRDDVAAMHVLQRATANSPETVAHSVVAQGLVRDLLSRDRKTIGRELRALARELGMAE